MANPALAMRELNRAKGGREYEAPDMVAATGAATLVATVEQALETSKKTREEVLAGLSASERRTIERLSEIGPKLEESTKALSEAIDGVSKREFPTTDLGPVLAALKDVKSAVKGIQVPSLDMSDVLLAVHMLRSELMDRPEPKPVDLSAIEERLAALEQPKEFEFDIERINAMPNSPIKRVTARTVS